MASTAREPIRTYALVVSLALSVTAAATGCAARAGGVVAGDDADDVLRARVESALASAADVHGEQIMVDARGGVVVLTGRVASGTEQQSVGAIVRAVPGVVDVRFALTVDDPGRRP